MPGRPDPEVLSVLRQSRSVHCRLQAEAAAVGLVIRPRHFLTPALVEEVPSNVLEDGAQKVSDARRFLDGARRTL